MALLKGYEADEKLFRPTNIAEKKALLRKTYGWLDWNWRDHLYVCQELQLPAKKVAEYDEKELDILIEYFEKGRMILFKD